MNVNDLPPATVARLPVYLRTLVEAQAQRMSLISSERIAQMSGGNAAQVRKDLSYLGELGTRGIGYDVESLIAQLSRRLGLTKPRNVAIVGFGRLGGALRAYGGFQDRGFTVVAVFDADPQKVGMRTADLTVSRVDDLERVIEERSVDVVVVTTPPSVAQEIADRAVDTGVRSILNFAPISIDVPEDVVVRQVDLAVELQILSFHLAKQDAG